LKIERYSIPLDHSGAILWIASDLREGTKRGGGSRWRIYETRSRSCAGHPAGGEASDEVPFGWIDLKIEGRTNEEIAYHVLLMDEAGFIEAQELCTMGPDGFDWKPKRLTYRGHQFLETIKEKEIWRLTKDAAKQGGSQALELIWEIRKAIGKSELRKRTGLEF
jgi:hypothetical protein